MDGFIRLRESDLAPVMNLEQFRNEFSLLSNVSVLQPAVSDTVLVDPYYGQVYDEWSGAARGIYGATDLILRERPKLAGDLGVLRVPFRESQLERVAT